MEYWIIGDEFLDEEIKKEAAAQGYLKELVQCKDCRYFEINHWEKVNEIPLIVAHEMCTRWGEGCKTTEDGYCFMVEKKKKESYFPKGFFSKERPIAKGEEDYDGKGIDYKTR